MKKARFGIIICVFVLCLGCLFVIVKYANWFGLPEPSYPISRHIEYSFTIQNKTNRLVRDAEFWTYAPLRQTSSQQCNHVEASHSFEVIFDSLGNQILHFKFHSFPPYATKIITIKADVMLSDTPNRVFLKDPDKHLGAQEFCETEDSEIIEVASNLAESGVMKTAENVLEWVGENVQYAGYLRQARGALYALKNEKGDCTEFMYLFAALCRASDIPTRCIGGYIVKQNAVLKARGFHNWAEFYEKGSWRLADPQHRVFAKNQSQYIGMTIIGDSEDSPMGNNNRFRLAGDGLTAKMNG